MTNLSSNREILGQLMVAGQPVQICASADAIYDAAAGSVAVTLTASARHLAIGGDAAPVSLPWLPAPQCVVEHVPHDEASALAREVFERWVHRVRRAMPAQQSLAESTSK